MKTKIERILHLIIAAGLAIIIACNIYAIGQLNRETALQKQYIEEITEILKLVSENNKTSNHNFRELQKNDDFIIEYVNYHLEHTHGINAKEILKEIEEK